MKLYLFGVLHASPICRNHYVSSLDAIFRDSGAPAFVAVEAVPHLFHNTILPQRERFRDLAMADSRFTHYEDSFVDTLAKCIGFEADAHAETYGQDGPPLLWLDEHRDREETDQGCAQSLGRNYYILFKDYLGPEPCATVEDAFLAIHDRITHSEERLVSPERKYRRDAKWAELIEDWMQRCSPEDHAIVTVGLDHLGSNPMSVLSRLAGVARCEPIDITKTEQSSNTYKAPHCQEKKRF